MIYFIVGIIIGLILLISWYTIIYKTDIKFREWLYRDEIKKNILSTLNIEDEINSLIGKSAKADHPITCLNPTEYFTIIDICIDKTLKGYKVSVRGDDTCWFNVKSVMIKEK